MVGQTQVQRVESILKQIRKLKEQYEKRAAITGEEFNVFEILGVERREVRHSAFLANMLNPKGSHRQGAVFLEHFLNLESRLADSSDDGKLYDFQVITEAATNSNDGRIDISLKNEDYACIIIENKIDAEDGAGQLNKYYWDAIEEGFAPEQIKLIYLTLCGEPPREESLAGQRPLDPNRVICISYENRIVEWLENCLKEVVGVAPVRETLFQYQMLVRKLTGQPINKEITMEIRDILIEEYDLITELENSIPKAKKQIQDNFWEKLAKKITQGCDLKVWDAVGEGRTFKVSRCELFPSFDIALRVELSGEVWYGFVLLENGLRVWKCKEERFKKYVTLVRDVVLKTRGHDQSTLGWKRLKYRNKTVSFSDFGAEQMRYVVKDDELKKMVDAIAQEIKDAVDSFIEAKKEASL